MFIRTGHEHVRALFRALRRRSPCVLLGGEGVPEY